MAVRVKICGITNAEDARAAAAAGADALGFIFFRGSPRFIEPEAAGRIIATLPPLMVKVGVFVDESAEGIAEAARRAGLDAVQLHGSEGPEFCAGLASLGKPVIKARRVKDRGSLAGLERYGVSALLLDSYVAGQLGGTGERFNWDLAVEAKVGGKPVILAGGLTAENVAEAVARAAPYGVDVSSGVEAAPGRKDHGKVREFIARAKGGG